MQNFRIYIGSNNKTGKLERGKIERTAQVMFSGFTIYETKGYWQGKAEKSAIVEITDNESKIKTFIKILKRKLNQESIGYQVQPTIKFM